MRILAAADVHGVADIYDWMANAVIRLRVDALVLAGDLLGSRTGFGIIREAQPLVSKLESLPAPVYFVMGNDDRVELEPMSAHVRSVNLQRFEHDGYNFVGYQYTLPFVGGVFERSEEACAHELQGLARLVDEQTVLVTHGPAAGILDSTPLGHVGSRALRRLIERTQPRVHVHGHVHECFGREGRHFNVATAGKRRAMIIDIDAMTHEVIED